MADITLKGKPIHTYSNLPEIGSTVPDFTLVNKDLEDVSLKDFPGKKILSIVPSLDTAVCSTSAKKFDKEQDPTILVISKDLPFAQKRFCELEKTKNIHTLSDMRVTSFGKDYGVLMIDGPLKGLFARAIIIVDENNKVLYTELVGEITEEPDYKKALNNL